MPFPLFAALETHDMSALGSYFTESLSPKKEELTPASFINLDMIQQFEEYRDELIGKWNKVDAKTQAITAKMETMKVSSFFDDDGPWFVLYSYVKNYMVLKLLWS